MGILKVGIGAAKSVLEDTWREYFYCPSMDADVLAKKGQNRKSKRSFNTKGSDNLISNGSIIAVNEGQAMIIVDQGAIVEFCAEAGEFVYDSSTEPSIFYGNLGESILASFKQFGRRVSFGGDTGKDQRVYFFNTKDIMGNKYGTANPVPFRVVDTNIGLDIDISIRCHGEYSYNIIDPILFYKNICGNVEDEFTKADIDSQLKSELLTALQPAFGKLSAMGIRYSALPGHTQEMADALNEVLSGKWGGNYGIAISAFGINSVKAPEEDEAMIKELQRNAVLKNPGMAAAHMTAAQAEAMKAAASNTSTGPIMAFAGMNMAAQTGGINTQALFEMNHQNQSAVNTAPAGQPVPASSKDIWTCSCGAVNTGKFCVECGSKKPEAGFWTCSCGTQNKGKFCMECGSKKPAGVPQYQCDKCGWEPADPTKPPKFCPECGDPFGEEDIK
ncbi:MAG: SPFH domain-containing protein [Lachnospiraceae bacterium]|nr:SPFH domain-containing protein [Lachnospiraceae bacterium]